MSKLYVGNLSYDCTDENLNEKFSEFGEVVEAITIRDRITGRSKGFGFVTFGDEESAKKATEAMNGNEWNGRTLRVDSAREARRDRGDRDRNRY